MFFPDGSTVIRGAPRLVAGAPGLVVGAPRLVPALPGAPRCSQVHPKFSPAHRGVPKLFTMTHVPVFRDLSYSEGRLECPPGVWYSLEIDASKFTLHILSYTPGGFQWLKHILLLHVNVIKQMKTGAARMQKGPERLELCAAYNLTRILRHEKDEKCTF